MMNFQEWMKSMEKKSQPIGFVISAGHETVTFRYVAPGGFIPNAETQRAAAALDDLAKEVSSGRDS